MFVCARLLGAHEFGLVAVAWAVIQLPTFFSYNLILLPTASTTEVNFGPKRSANSLALYLAICGLTWAITPLLLANADPSGSLSGVLVAAWAMGLLAADFVRWTAIRVGGGAFVLGSTLLRWTLLVGATLLTPVQARSADLFVLFSLLTALLSIAATFVFVPSTFTVLAVKPRFSKTFTWESLPLLANASAAAVLQYLTVSSMTAVFGIAAVGLLQAYRSLANGLAMPAQFVDNHWTAMLARQNRTPSLPLSLVLFIAVGTALAAAVGFALSSFASVLLGPGYEQGQWLFGVFLAGAAIHSLTRPIAALLRLSQDAAGLYTNAGLTLVVVTPIALALSSSGNFVAVALCLAMAPATLIAILVIVKLRATRVRPLASQSR